MFLEPSVGLPHCFDVLSVAPLPFSADPHDVTDRPRKVGDELGLPGSEPLGGLSGSSEISEL